MKLVNDAAAILLIKNSKAIYSAVSDIKVGTNLFFCHSFSVKVQPFKYQILSLRNTKTSFEGKCIIFNAYCLKAHEGYIQGSYL